MTETGANDVTGGQDSAETETSETEEIQHDAVAELEKWKKHSRTWEDRSKQNLAELQAAKQKLEAIDTDKANADIVQARKDAEDARREASMLRVAFKHKLTSDDLELLAYVPVDELESAAEKLAARTQRAYPELGQGVGQPGVPKDDMNSRIRRAAGLE